MSDKQERVWMIEYRIKGTADQFRPTGGTHWHYYRDDAIRERETVRRRDMEYRVVVYSREATNGKR